MEAAEQPARDDAAGLRPEAPKIRDLAPETLRLYAADWADFVAWSRRELRSALPAEPDSVACYLHSLTGTLRPGALARRAAAIADQHRRLGHVPPTLDEAVKSVLRAARLAAAPSRRARRAGVAQLARMAAGCPGDLAGQRDRALLLLALASEQGGIKLGRGALLGLDAEHIRFADGDIELLVSDRAGVRTVPVARDRIRGACPVRALEEWLRSSECRYGPVFRKVDRWGNVEHNRLGIDALRRIWIRRRSRGLMGQAVEQLRLAHTDWLHHRLVVGGPSGVIAAFRGAASGAGTVPWHLDVDRVAEDCFHLLVAPAPPQQRSLSAAGARILAEQLSHAVARRHGLAAARVGRSRACPFDLHSLVPVPAEILRGGPDHPDAMAWLWEHWGTTEALRHVTEEAADERRRVPVADGEALLCLTFWSADWTPWRALARIAGDWPALRLDIQPGYDVP